MRETLRSPVFWATILGCALIHFGWKWIQPTASWSESRGNLPEEGIVLPSAPRTEFPPRGEPNVAGSQTTRRTRVLEIPSGEEPIDPVWQSQAPLKSGTLENAPMAPEPPEGRPQKVTREESVSTGTIVRTSGEEPDRSNSSTPPQRAIESGDLATVHRELSQRYWKHPELRRELLPQLQKTAEPLFFQPQPHVLEPYVIQPGDQLQKIANKHKISWQYLAKLNNVDPKRIQVGKRLKVIQGPFSAMVELSDFSLTIHLQGHFVKRYAVGIGKDHSSPVGKFTVLNKVENPQYTDPDGRVIDANDPRNPLGERWIDLGNSYGIHGTIDPKSIGKAESRGCIRLLDSDIIEVYDFLTTGSEVVIRK